VGYRLRMSGEIHDWLADLNETDPPAAMQVGQALAALMSEGAGLGSPLVVPVAATWPEDMVAALDASYERRLDRLRVMRKRAAEAAWLVKDLRAQIDELESAQARLEDQRRGALEEGRKDDAAFQRFGRPLDPRTGVPMAEEILPGAAERAAGLLADVAEQRWTQVTSGFDARMTKALDARRLAAAWAQVVGIAGEYQGMGQPVARQAGDYTVVNVPLRFEAAELTGRFSYDRAAQVAGLYFLNQP
jgi:Protein of unknown function (DUF3887)